MLRIPAGAGYGSARLGSMKDAAMDQGAVRARLFAGLLGEAGTATPDQVAKRAGVSADAAAETLADLEREGLLERMPEGAYRAARLDSREVRELYPAVLLLEAIAVRDAPGFESDTFAALRAANARLKATGDPDEASQADDQFHRLLTAGCGNAKLLAVLDPVRRALLPYETVYMGTAERRARSAAQHDAIVDALERGDRTTAADLVRQNFTSALPDLTAELDAREEGREAGPGP
jgi:DNA-binding GntR family transcriptional regulator